MNEFIGIVTAFPTVFFSIGLIFVAVFWLLSIVGVADIEMFDFDLDIDADVDTGSFGDLSGFLLRFGLNGIPVTVVISLLMLVAWLLSYFASSYFIAFLPFDWLRYVAGVGVIIGCLAVALPITSMSLSPTKHLFTGATASTRASFVGGKAVVTTLEVSDSFGQAEVHDGGAGLLVDVRAELPNNLTKGSTVALLAYDDTTGTYMVMDDAEFMKL